jgi:hypothetical protein
VVAPSVRLTQVRIWHATTDFTLKIPRRTADSSLIESYKLAIHLGKSGSSPCVSAPATGNAEVPVSAQPELLRI